MFWNGFVHCVREHDIRFPSLHAVFKDFFPHIESIYAFVDFAGVRTAQIKTGFGFACTHKLICNNHSVMEVETSTIIITASRSAYIYKLLDVWVLYFHIDGSSTTASIALRDSESRTIHNFEKRNSTSRLTTRAKWSIVSSNLRPVCAYATAAFSKKSVFFVGFENV